MKTLIMTRVKKKEKKGRLLDSGCGYQCMAIMWQDHKCMQKPSSIRARVAAPTPAHDALNVRYCMSLVGCTVLGVSPFSGTKWAPHAALTDSL